MCLLPAWIIFLYALINIKAHPTTTHAHQDKWEPPLLLTAQPEGVSISGAEDLLQIVASWDTFVTLEPPHPADLPEKVAELYVMSKHSSAINCTFFSHELVSLQHPTSLSTTAVVSLLVFLFYHFHRYFVL